MERRRFPKQVIWTSRGEKSFERLDSQLKEEVETMLERYARTGEGKVERLHGIPYVKMEIRGWRIVLDETDNTIEVIFVQKRGDVYKQLTRRQR